MNIFCRKIFNHPKIILKIETLCELETRALKQVVKRNLDRFPDDFMDELTDTEINLMVSQNVIPSKRYFGGAKPFAFTEQGVAMLSNVLKSKKALQININIMRVFVEVRKAMLFQSKIIAELTNVRLRLGEHDLQLKAIYDAMENLLDKKNRKNWTDRERIGFKTDKGK